ncbi:MAG: DUF5655 domain-containing protein [Thermodesulfobacteriota bacterium]
MPIYYAVTNPAFVKQKKDERREIKLVKFGQSTDFDTIPGRIKTLQSSGVPKPFEVIRAIQVPKKDRKNYENLIHKALDEARYASEREFFTIGQEGAIAMMEIIPGKDVTSEVKKRIRGNKRGDTVGQKKKQEKQKTNSGVRSPFTFSSVGLKRGTILRFKGDSSITAKVLNDKEIKFRGKDISLSGAAKELLSIPREKGGVQGPIYWLYKGKTLDEMRKEFERRKKKTEKKSKSQNNYSLDAHLKVANQGTRSLFEKFKQKMFALGSGVTEEPKAKYIAYKSPTTFASVVIGKSELKIYINLKRGHLKDPKKLARDVKDVGHWGGGHYEVKLKNAKNIGKFVSLIRQSYVAKSKQQKS